MRASTGVDIATVAQQTALSAVCPGSRSESVAVCRIRWARKDYVYGFAPVAGRAVDALGSAVGLAEQRSKASAVSQSVI